MQKVFNEKAITFNFIPLIPLITIINEKAMVN
jgi:hypothetical protein